MADILVDGIDDGLAPGADIIDAVVEIEDPVERLLRRGDVVAMRAEYDDLPTKSWSTIHCISSALSRTRPPQYFSKPR
jgi:hypothetical protein